MGKLLEKARKDNEHQHADENRPELDVQSPSRNDEHHDRRTKRDHSRDDHREEPQVGMTRSRRPSRPPYACGLAHPPGSIPMGDKKAAHVGDAAFWG